MTASIAIADGWSLAAVLALAGVLVGVAVVVAIGVLRAVTEEDRLGPLARVARGVEDAVAVGAPGFFFQL